MIGLCDDIVAGRDQAGPNAALVQLAHATTRRGLRHWGNLLGPGIKVPTRPKLDLATAERELQIARDDLHRNAVRVGGHLPPSLHQFQPDKRAIEADVHLP